MDDFEVLERRKETRRVIKFLYPNVFESDYIVKIDMIPMFRIGMALEAWKMCDGNTPAAARICGEKEFNINKWVEKHYIPTKTSENTIVVKLRSKV